MRMVSILFLSSILLACPGVASAWYNLPGSLQSIFQHTTNNIEVSSSEPQASEHSYTAHLLSEDPLVIYISSFISPQEATHLVSLSEPKFKPSVLWSDDGKVNVDSTYRSSDTATLDRDKVIEDIEARARAFPPYQSQSSGLIKPLVVQKYGLAGQYKDHYDWFLNDPSLTGNIESTFFVYIEANCTGGGTNFPRLKVPMDDEKWCEFIDCDRPYEDGVTFKPITGNAIYWRNLDQDGRGLPSTLHAGLPVTSGRKMGMNIWTWTPFHAG